MDLREKVCVVTGGALGIGRCLARAFAKLGAKVAFLDMDKQAGERALAQLREMGADALFFHGDAAQEQALRDFAEQIRQAYGGVDVLVNNACLTRRGILSGCSYEEFNYVLRVGVSAPYLLTSLLLPLFRPGASVVNLSSTRAFQSQADTESYTAAKGGVTALTHALAVSLKGRVRVNAIAPGWIDTGAEHQEGYAPAYTAADRLQHPSARVGAPEDIARAVLFLCDPKNDFINGHTLTVDGGMSKLMVYTDDEGWRYQPQ